jgi:hypothetical protein
LTAQDQSHAHATAPAPVDETVATTADDLQRYGITSREHTTYEWNGYRYSNSADAIAAAKRAAR